MFVGHLRGVFCLIKEFAAEDFVKKQNVKHFCNHFEAILKEPLLQKILHIQKNTY